MHAITVPPSGKDDTWIGERLKFFGNHTDVVTSPVEHVGRPDKGALEHYISLAAAGAIAC